MEQSRCRAENQENHRISRPIVRRKGRTARRLSSPEVGAIHASSSPYNPPVRRTIALAVAAVLVLAGAAVAPALRAASSSSFWTTVGPYGGVVLALAAFPTNPEVLYAGVEHGGVFRSDDAGLNWRSVSAGLPDLNVTSLAVSPADANVIVLGALSGLYVSVDGGVSWTVAPGSPGSAINDVAFDPTDSTIAYAVSSAGWAGRSVDGGVSWNPMGSSVFAQQPTAIAVAASAPATLYLGTNLNGVYRSTDSGATWTDKNNGLTNLHVSALAVDPRNAMIVYAGTANGPAFISGDGGELWGASGPFSGVHALAVDASGNAYAALNVGTAVLPSGSTQWSSLGAAQWVNAFALGSGSPQRLFVGHGNLPFDVGGVARIDSTTTTFLDNGLTGVTVNAIGVDAMDAQTRILLGTVGDGLLQSQDGGRTWTRVAGLNQNSILDIQVVAGAPEAFYAASAAGIFRSTDEGATWTSVANGIPTNPPTPVASLLISTGGGAAFLAGTYHGLYRSTDSAASWTQVTDGLPAQVIYSLARDPASADVVYAATEQGVFKSTNDGASWTATGGGIAGNLVYDVAVVGGAVFAAGEGGLFRSSNGGASWDALGGGLPSAAAHALAYDSTASTLYAGTYAGVWQSTDFGNTWTRVAAGPSNPQILSVGVLPGGGLIAGTLGGSAYVLSTPEPREPVVRPVPRSSGTRTLAPRP